MGIFGAKRILVTSKFKIVESPERQASRSFTSLSWNVPAAVTLGLRLSRAKRPISCIPSFVHRATELGQGAPAASDGGVYFSYGMPIRDTV